MALIDNDQLKKFKEALADIIVSSQGLCTYDACKDVAEREATFLISTLLPEPNIQSSNIRETIRVEIEQQRNLHSPISFSDSYEVGYSDGYLECCDNILAFLDTLPEQPDKETILQICKLHKAWSIIAPWENVEDFIITNWNSENIV